MEDDRNLKVIEDRYGKSEKDGVNPNSFPDKQVRLNFRSIECVQFVIAAFGTLDVFAYLRTVFLIIQQCNL